MTTTDRLEQMANCKEVLEFIHRKDVVETQSYESDEDRGEVVKTFSGYERELEIRIVFDVRMEKTFGDRMQEVDKNHKIDHCIWDGERVVELDQATKEELINTLDLSE